MVLSRRQFVKSSAIASGGLVVGFNLTACQALPYPAKKNGALQPNAFLQVTTDNQVVLQIHKAEMGQGVTTGLATLVAEELKLAPELLTLEFALNHPDFADPKTHMMVTGGSNSIANNHMTVRTAAASLRELLLASAASIWQIPVAQCYIDEKTVKRNNGQGQLAFKDLIAVAQKLPIPKNPPLVAKPDYQYIGKPRQRLDAKVKTDGTAMFAMDYKPPGMLYAIVIRCPQAGGKVLSYDASKVIIQAGIKEVVEIPSGIAIVANSYWQARQAAPLLEVHWQSGPLEKTDSTAINEKNIELLNDADTNTIRDDGDHLQTNISRTITAEYSLPYLAHATMEPQNALADVTHNHCEIWAPNQSPDTARAMAADATGLAPELITIHSTWLGGGFGRRAVTDYVYEAARISQLVTAPIKLIWSREDDIRHDYYRPASRSRLQAQISNTNDVYQWTHRIVGPSLLKQALNQYGSALIPKWIPDVALEMGGSFIKTRDPTSVEGAADIPYDFANVKVDYIYWDSGLPIGFWRSVGHSHNAFVVESFVDEIAHALKQDPLKFRIKHLAKHPRQLQVLQLAAEKAQWGRRRPGNNGIYQGISVHESFGSKVAQVAEVSVIDNKIRVHKVVCAIDCGEVINPDIVKSQMESGIIFGLTAALKGEITIKNGAVEQSNFHDYPMLRMDETPHIEVYLIDSNEVPTGVGEPGLPPLAPAVANAVFAATKQRLRHLPLKLV